MKIVKETRDCDLQSQVNVTLIESIFNCTSLPECQINCGAPNEPVIRQATYEASCRSESLFHVMVLRMICIAVVYACLNISRALAIAGICRIFWRALTHEGFLFKATCSDQGQTDESQKVLRTKVQQMVASFERWAFGFLTLAVLIHLPYFILLALLPDPVTKTSYWNGYDKRSA